MSEAGAPIDAAHGHSIRRTKQSLRCRVVLKMFVAVWLLFVAAVLLFVAAVLLALVSACVRGPMAAADSGTEQYK